jgi:hypothetical protein
MHIARQVFGHPAAQSGQDEGGGEDER